MEIDIRENFNWWLLVLNRVLRSTKQQEFMRWEKFVPAVFWKTNDVKSPGGTQNISKEIDTKFAMREGNEWFACLDRHRKEKSRKFSKVMQMRRLSRTSTRVLLDLPLKLIRLQLWSLIWSSYLKSFFNLSPAVIIWIIHIKNWLQIVISFESQIQWENPQLFSRSEVLILCRFSQGSSSDRNSCHLDESLNDLQSLRSFKDCQSRRNI
jgi:hypothetical protein